MEVGVEHRDAAASSSALFYVQVLTRLERCRDALPEESFAPAADTLSGRSSAPDRGGGVPLSSRPADETLRHKRSSRRSGAPDHQRYRQPTAWSFTSEETRAAKTAMSCSARSCSRYCATNGAGCVASLRTGCFPVTDGIQQAILSRRFAHAPAGSVLAQEAEKVAQRFRLVCGRRTASKRVEGPNPQNV